MNISKQYSPNSCGLQSAGGRAAFRAVVFAGGFAPEPNQADRFFSFLGTPDCVVAADSGLRTCFAYADFFSGRCKLAPEAILGDFDSLSAEEREAARRTASAAFKAFPCDKDDTDTELAVRYAYRRALRSGCASPHVSIVGGDGGRIDHLLNIYDSFAAQNHPSVWLCREQGVWLLESGCTAEIRNLSAEDVVSVARTAAARQGGAVVSRGLRWESDVFRAVGMPSISNRIAPDFFSRGEPVVLRAEESDFLLVLPLHVVAEIRRVP